MNTETGNTKTKSSLEKRIAKLQKYVNTFQSIQEDFVKIQDIKEAKYFLMKFAKKLQLLTFGIDYEDVKTKAFNELSSETKKTAKQCIEKIWETVIELQRHLKYLLNDSKIDHISILFYQRDLIRVGCYSDTYYIW